MIELETAQKLIEDDTAVSKGYLTQTVLNHALAIVKEKKEKGIDRRLCKRRDNRLDRFSWYKNLESYREMFNHLTEAGMSTKRYDICCELVDNINELINELS